MLISVIVPVYNVEKYLADCVESILQQTFRDFELILIDDGSKDRSGEICDAFAETDDRIVVVHQDNQGQSKTRNYGVLISKGEYIVFVDSDDLIFPHYLETLYKESQNSGAELVICSLLKMQSM